MSLACNVFKKIKKNALFVFQQYLLLQTDVIKLHQSMSCIKWMKCIVVLVSEFVSFSFDFAEFLYFQPKRRTSIVI